MRLWIESTHQSVTQAGAQMQDVICTFQTEGQFLAFLMSCAIDRPLADRAIARLSRPDGLDATVKMLLAAVPSSATPHLSFALLQIQAGAAARLVECNAPPLFMTRRGRLVVLPVLEEEYDGHLVRTCDFNLEDGDHIAMASEGYFLAKRQNQRWGWRDIATSVRRLTDTRCSAAQLLKALMSATGTPRPEPVSVIAMFVRPQRVVTIWSGPPANRGQDQMVLDKWRTAAGQHVICGDTTAKIAARLSGAELILEPRPADGWAEVPPTFALAGADLVTEGLVTLGKTRERMAEARQVQDLPRQEDGATRLARLLLAADKIQFLVGLAVNPVQATQSGTVPLRQVVIRELEHDLKARGKFVSVEYF